MARFVPFRLADGSSSTATLGCAVFTVSSRSYAIGSRKKRTGKSACATKTSIARGRQLRRGRFLGMKRLQRRNLQCLLDQRANPASCRIRGGKSGDARNIVTNCRTADGFLVVKRFASERSVDDHVHLAGLH